MSDSTEGVANTGELEKQARETRDGWVKSGKPAGTATPPPEPPAPAAPPAPTPPAPATEPPGPGASAAEVQEFIDAIIRDAEGETPAEVLRIPLGARIPLEVEGKIVYKPFKEIRDGGMREEDYHGKTTEVAQSRRQLEEHAARLVADRARLEARTQWLTEEQQRLRDAQKDPAKWEAYQNHLRLMAEDPEYAKTFEDALVGRERTAMDRAEEAALHQEIVAEGIAQAADWILEIGNEPAFASVDLDRVRVRYADELQRGTAGLDPAAVRRIFDSEAQYLSSSLTPLQEQVKALTAQVAQLRGTDQTGDHNRATEHALKRAAAPPVVTGQPAAPAAPDKKVAPFTPRQLPEVNAAWAARRD